MSKVDRPPLIHMAAVLITLLILAPLTLAEAADFQAGMEAYDRGDFTAAMREWRPLAEQGHAEAQTHLGLMYAKGKGVPQDDAEAAKWLRKAAEQGHANAQVLLGMMYAKGRKGVPQDDAEAVKWVRKAAEQGLGAGQAILGLWYWVGMGVPEDSIQAYAWLNIATAQGFMTEKDKEEVAETMTREEIARAQKLAREYWKKYVLPFRD